MKLKKINILRSRELPWVLKNVRKTAGLTQSELAKLCGVTRQTITEWETSKRSPQPRNLQKWMRAIEDYTEKESNQK